MKIFLSSVSKIRAKKYSGSVLDIIGFEIAPSMLNQILKDCLLKNSVKMRATAMVVVRFLRY